MNADRPNRIPWPPIILVCSVMGAVLLSWLVPLQYPAFAQNGFFWFLGVLIMTAGAMLDLMAIIAMKRAATNILPHKGADKLLTTGIFGYSRNPIYTGNTLLIAGTTLVSRLVWFIPAAIAAGVAVHYLAIKREEKHLLEKFGEDWTNYARQTPRWLMF